MDTINVNIARNNAVSTFNGYCYKDENAYKEGKGVCYIAEYDLFDDDNIEEDCISGFTRQDFLALCGNEKEAEALFSSLDWQHPETLWNEWLDSDILEEKEQ